jgi:hypothetical protein
MRRVEQTKRKDANITIGFEDDFESLLSCDMGICKHLLRRFGRQGG